MTLQKLRILKNWWVLLVNSVEINEYYQLELLRALKLSDSLLPLLVGEGEEAQSSIFDGNSS